MSISTFPAMVGAALRADSSRPLVTFYDDVTGERVELSRATYANWVSKTAGLVADELDVERGCLVLLDLPTHWLGAVWLGAAWSVGLSVTTDPGLAKEADLVVCGPGRVGDYSGLVDEAAVVAISLRPLGGRFTVPLPSGVLDYGAVVLAQPDIFAPIDPPSGSDPAWRRETDRVGLTQEDLLASVADEPLVGVGGRLLSDVNPCSWAGLGTLLSPLLRDAATIWVANPDEATWQAKYDAERATAQLRATADG